MIDEKTYGNCQGTLSFKVDLKAPLRHKNLIEIRVVMHVNDKSQDQRSFMTAEISVEDGINSHKSNSMRFSDLVTIPSASSLSSMNLGSSRNSIFHQELIQLLTSDQRDPSILKSTIAIVSPIEKEHPTEEIIDLSSDSLESKSPLES
jgi:hypothetical protein